MFFSRDLPSQRVNLRGEFKGLHGVLLDQTAGGEVAPAPRGRRVAPCGTVTAITLLKHTSIMILENTMLSGNIRHIDLISVSQLFDQMPHCNIISYNIIIFAYTQASEVDFTRALFDHTPDKNNLSPRMAFLLRMCRMTELMTPATSSGLGWSEPPSIAG